MMSDASEYALCVKDDGTGDENCPITSFAFTLDGKSADEAAKYKSANTINDQTSSKFYYSK